MESVRRAGARLKQYPAHVAKCADSAGAYAACVTRDLNVEHRACDREFRAFRECLQKVATEAKTRL